MDTCSYFHNKVVFITGASRGIGRSLALKLSEHGARIVIASKSTIEHPLLEGTIYSVAKEIEAKGGQALPIQVDIRFEDQIIYAVQETIRQFQGIDILVNNASAIALLNTDKIDAKKFDLMYQINVRGTFLVAKYCFPFLRKGKQSHIITLSPPLNLDMKWFQPHVAYTLSKYNMTMLALNWAAEWLHEGIASNAIWPQTLISTAAIKNLLGGEMMLKKCRTPAIVVDAIMTILQKEHLSVTGKSLIDEHILREEGVTDFNMYAIDSSQTPQRDLFL